MDGTGENQGSPVDGAPDVKGTRKVSRPLTRPIELASLKLAYQKASKRLKIFLAGPFIEKDMTPDEVQGLDAAARLRLHLLGFLETRNEVSLGEHRGILDLTSDFAGGLAQAALSEIALIKNEMDAVVIIPASAGSFCELGAWSGMDQIARRMIILCDENHEGKVSYLSAGVVTLAKYFGAEVHWVDYFNTEICENIVDNFLSMISGRILTREIING